MCKKIKNGTASKNGEIVKLDLLNRDPFIRSMFDLIKKQFNENREEGIVIGLSGKWGEGKSFIIDKLILKLKQDNIKVVVYNPWHFIDKGEVRNNFAKYLFEHTDGYFKKSFVKILEYLESSEQLWRDIFKVLLSSILYLIIFYILVVFYVLQKEKLDIIEYFFNNIEKFLTLFGVGTAIAKYHDELISILYKLILRAKKGTSFNDLQDSIKSFLQKKDEKLVVIVEDLDRVYKNDILNVFSLLKLNTNIKDIIFIVPYDRDILMEKIESESRNGSDILRKVFSKEIVIPKVESDVYFELFFNEVKKHCNRITDESKLRYELSEIRLGDLLNDLRTIEKILDNIDTKVQTIRSTGFLLFNLSDLVFVEIINYLTPSLYEDIRLNSSYYLIEDRLLDRELELSRSHIKSVIENLKYPKTQSSLLVFYKLFKGIEDHLTSKSKYKYTQVDFREMRLFVPPFFRMYFGGTFFSKYISYEEYESILLSFDEDGGRTGVQSLINGNKLVSFLEFIYFFEDANHVGCKQSFFLEVIKQVNAGTIEKSFLYNFYSSSYFQNNVEGVRDSIVKKIFNEKIVGTVFLEFVVAFDETIVRENKWQSFKAEFHEYLDKSFFVEENAEMIAMMPNASFRLVELVKQKTIRLINLKKIKKKIFDDDRLLKIIILNSASLEVVGFPEQIQFDILMLDDFYGLRFLEKKIKNFIQVETMPKTLVKFKKLLETIEKHKEMIKKETKALKDQAKAVNDKIYLENSLIDLAKRLNSLSDESAGGNVEFVIKSDEEYFADEWKVEVLGSICTGTDNDGTPYWSEIDNYLDNDFWRHRNVKNLINNIEKSVIYAESQFKPF